MSRERSMRFSMIDGFFATILTGFTNNYIIPFALVLGASAMQIGTIYYLPVLFACIFQLLATDLAKPFKSRKYYVVFFVMLQALLWIAVSAVYVLPYEQRVVYFIIFVALNSVIGALNNPVWGELMSDIVGADELGEFFGGRYKVLGFSIMVFSIIGGIVLSNAENKMAAFIILFAIGGAARIISGIYIGRLDDPPASCRQEESLSYMSYVAKYWKTNMFKFSMYIALLGFFSTVAGPFVAVYMLDELRMDYFTFALVLLVAALVGHFTASIWHKHTEKYGALKIIKVISKIIPLIPLLYLFSGNWFFVCIIVAFNGYIWSGFWHARGNYLYDACVPDNRKKCFVYSGFTSGVIAGAGALLGGWIVENLHLSIGGSVYLPLFLIASAGMFTVNSLMIDAFQELKRVPETHETEVLYNVLGISTIMSVSNELFIKDDSKK